MAAAVAKGPKSPKTPSPKGRRGTKSPSMSTKTPPTPKKSPMKAARFHDQSKIKGAPMKKAQTKGSMMQFVRHLEKETQEAYILVVEHGHGKTKAIVRFMDGGVMDIEVPIGMRLQEKTLYWIQFRAYKDATEPTASGETQALITKSSFVVASTTFQKRLIEASLIDDVLGQLHK